MATTRSFQRSPRIHQELPTAEEELTPPEPLPTRPSTTMASRLEDALFAGGASIVVAGVTAVATHSGFTALVGGLGTLGFGVLRSVIGFRREMRAYTDACAARTEKQVAYLAQKRAEWLAIASRQRDVLVAKDPEPNECLQRAERIDVRLFERSMADDDFLSPRIGLGHAPFSVQIKSTTSNDAGDEICKKTDELATDFTSVDNVPVCASFRRLGAGGVVGPRYDALNTARCILMQIATHHAASEVKCVIVHPPDEDWAWTRWLPHVWTDDWQSRFLATDREGVRNLFAGLYSLLKRRQLKAKENDSRPQLPVYVFIFASAALVEGEPLIDLVIESGQSIGTLGIFVRESVKDLPKGCSTIIEASTGRSKIIVTGTTTSEHYVSPDEVDVAQAERFARALAPIRVQTKSAAGNIPTGVTLLDMVGVKSVAEMDVLDTWKRNEPYKSMAVPIGLQSGGKRLLHNLHETGHGPHGLVAGTTGSGKTVFLSTYLALLATWFHPHEVAFVAVDYKGGDLYRGLENLPHLVATLTNLDKSQVWRSLRALQAENERRMKLFTKASHENGVSVSKIDEYQVLARAGKAEPLPKLIIMCDEFAELSKQEPEFIARLVSIARVGRSLGVHLILATQQPAGIIGEQIESNTRFRIAFKFNKDEDSKAVIKRPDAATIREPGRAYFQLGENEVFELFQSAYGGAEYDEQTATISDQPSISQLSSGGTRRVLGLTPAKTSAEKKPNQLQAVAKKLAEEAAASGIQRLPGPWLDPLPTSLTLNDVNPADAWSGSKWTPSSRWLAPVVGLLDDPDHTYQGPLIVDFPSQGHLAIFGKPGAGCTTFLQSLILSLTKAHSPDDVTFYLMDFGGQLLVRYGKLPHTGDVVLADDADRVVRLLRFLLRKLQQRKQMFGHAGTSTLVSYREATKEKVPAIVLILDNYLRFSKSYPDSEDVLATIVQEGASLGLYVVFTANSPSNVKQKIAGNVSSTVALQLADRSEYSVAVGPLENLVPATLVGRGLVKGKPPLEFQTALPVCGASEQERNSMIDQMISAMDASWSGPRPEQVPIVPDVLHLDALLRLAPQGSLSVPLGVDVEEVQPFRLAPADGPHFIVTGPLQSGKTRFLMSVATALASLVPPDRLRVTLIDFREGHLQPLARLPHIRSYVDNDDKLTEAIEVIREAHSLRREGLKTARESAGGVLDDNQFLLSQPADVVLIDDFEQIRDSASAINLDAIISLIKSSRGPGLHFILAGEINDMGSNGYDGLMRVMSGLKTGILLGTRDDNGIFGNVRIPPEQALFKAGEGYFVQRGVVRNRIRLARPDVDPGQMLRFIDEVVTLHTAKN